MYVFVVSIIHTVLKILNTISQIFSNIIITFSKKKRFLLKYTYWIIINSKTLYFYIHIYKKKIILVKIFCVLW